MTNNTSGVISLAEMSAEKMLPFVKSHDRRAYKKHIEREMKAKNILEPVILGNGNARRFYIPRKNIKKLIKAVDKGYSF